MTVELREFIEARLAEGSDGGGWCGCDGHLRLRAARWSDHPDYLQEWAP